MSAAETLGCARRGPQALQALLAMRLEGEFSVPGLPPATASAGPYLRRAHHWKMRPSQGLSEANCCSHTRFCKTEELSTLVMGSRCRSIKRQSTPNIHLI